MRALCVPAASFTSLKLFTPLFFSLPSPQSITFCPATFPCSPLLSTPQAEQVSLSHVVDLLSLILLTAIWAVCPRDSLALLGQWVQDKLVQVRQFCKYMHMLACGSSTRNVI